MLHLLASLVSLFLLAGAAAAVTQMVRGEWARIVAALVRAPAAPAARPWASRVRVTAASRPALLRSVPARAAA